VVALTPRDEITPLRFAALNEILPRQFNRRFHRLRSAAGEKRMAQLFRRVNRQLIGKFFGRLRGEEAAVRIFELIQLRAQSADDVGMRVAETGYPGPAGGINIFLSGFVTNEDAMAGRRARVAMRDCAMHDMGHLRRRLFERWIR
jgi:hypothetical protein